MRPFSYARASDVGGAIAAATSGAAFLAGGTNVVDLMKIDVEAPRALIDINALPLTAIARSDGMLRLGALARMSDVADAPVVRGTAPAIAESLELSASGQLRNMASIGGNIMQRTRCAYFRDVAAPCNKRVPGSGCSALTGDNATHAILGISDACIAVHPSDFAVVLTAFDAIVAVEGANGARTIPIGNFFLKPERTPDRETTLAPHELIIDIALPCTPALERSTYVKVRDRASYEFALVSCAAGMQVAGDGTIADVRIALGGVATVPWRAHAAEAELRGKKPAPALFAKAAATALAGAQPTLHNAYKREIAMAAIVRALETVNA